MIEVSAAAAAFLVGFLVVISVIGGATAGESYITQRSRSIGLAICIISGVIVATLLVLSMFFVLEWV